MNQSALKKAIDSIKRKNPALRAAAILSAALLILILCCGCERNTSFDPLEGVETKEVQDDTGRTVTVPKDITRVAPSGQVAQMMLVTLVPDLLVGLSVSPSTSQMEYYPEEVTYLPTFGQFYGKKSTLNLESLVEAEPQVTIDLGDRKRTIKIDLAGIQKKTNIPTLFYESTIEKMPEAYRFLGTLLGREEKAEKMAAFVEKTLRMAEKNSAKIPEDRKLSVLFGTGATGLAVNADGSSHAHVLDLVGARNAIVPDVATDKGGGTIVSLEEVYETEPDVIIQANHDLVMAMDQNEWANLKAVRDGKYYWIPQDPYSWMSAPPSINMVLGVWWLGQLLYPDIYNDYDMGEIAKEYYKLFWNYDLTDRQVKEFLKDSTLKALRAGGGK